VREKKKPSCSKWFLGRKKKRHWVIGQQYHTVICRCGSVVRGTAFAMRTSTAGNYEGVGASPAHDKENKRSPGGDLRKFSTNVGVT